MPDDNPTPDELRARGFTEDEIAEIARITTEGVWHPTREAFGDDPVDPLIGFYWARLDEEPDSADVRAKREILDDYAARCADLDNPARELECQLIRDVIKRLATVYAEHPDYTADFRPAARELSVEDTARRALRPVSRDEQRDIHAAITDFETERRKRRQEYEGRWTPPDGPDDEPRP